MSIPTMLPEEGYRCSNIESRLHIRNSLTDQQRERFDLYFMGAIASLSDERLWEHCLNIADKIARGQPVYPSIDSTDRKEPVTNGQNITES